MGNIGKVALDAVAENDRKSIYEHTEFFVAELSSYQLTLCKKFKPQVSVLLNITPDHLDWHGGFDGYKRAKFKVFNNAHTAVINQEDKTVSSNIDTIKEQVSELISVNTHQDLIIVNYKNKDFEIVNNEDLKLIGEHNYSNARCAAAVCLALGLTPDQISSGLVSFPPLEHRLELCGYVAGMYLYNDSKATNVDSVMVAMDAFPKEKAIFLMGGKDKHTDLAKLVEKAYKNLKGVILFGQAQGRFYEEFMKLEKPENFVIEKSDNMKTSFKLALEISSPGDYIVLSPACSSFDEFDNFEHRGNTFKKLVDMCKR